MNKETFFKKHVLALNTGDSYVSVKYNYEILLQKWGQNLKFHNEERPRELVREIFWDIISCNKTYYEPFIFDEKIALECDLIPFTYKGRNMLAITIVGVEEYINRKLDEYQVLTHGTIDEKSLYFVKDERAYFKQVVGQRAMAKINEILDIK